MQHYRVDLERVAAHLILITYRFAPPAGAAEVTVSLPTWCPGSYLIRDYARMIRGLRAADLQANDLAVRKVTKSSWVVAAPAQGDIVITYTLYAHELTVRTNYATAEQAFLHGPATFLYCEALRAAPATVTITAKPGWLLATGLAFGGHPLAQPAVLHAASIDELFDMPLYAASAAICKRLVVPAKRTSQVELVMVGKRKPGGPFDEARLLADLAAIVDDHIARVGEAPFDHYTFVLSLTHDGYGGLEHRNSSINIFASNFAATRKQYEGLLELLSHEFFHCWNGKRIAPPALLAFDYSQEAYTRCLWVMEGLTSHYDRLALLTAGVITEKSFLDKVLDDWTRLLAIPGRTEQSLEASSFDAWIKLYKPDESNVNTTVSYYLKGGLAALALDLEIRRRTEGQKSLDDVLVALWRSFGKLGLPHPENVQPLFEAATGLDLSLWFDTVVRGTADPALPAELGYVGLLLTATNDGAIHADGATPGYLGITMSGARITAVFDGSTAQQAGLSVGDELVACDGFRVSGEADLRAAVAAAGVGQAVVLTLFRQHLLTHITVPLAPLPPTKFEIATRPDAAPDALARGQRWLGHALLPGTLATVTTTARAL